MSLQDAIERYIAWRQAHGAKFENAAGILHRFCGSIGGETGCDAVTDAQVRSFLEGVGP